MMIVSDIDGTFLHVYMYICTYTHVHVPCTCIVFARVIQTMYIHCIYFSADAFLPSPDSLLVNLKESKDVSLHII